MNSSNFDRAQSEYERRRMMSPEDEEDACRLRQRLDERDLDRADHLRDEEKDNRESFMDRFIDTTADEEDYRK